MTEQNQDGTQRIFISEVQRHQARYRKLIQFTHSSTKAAGAMLLAAVVALIVANTGAYEAFLEFWHTEAGFFFGDAFAGVINDIFRAVFFLLVGLEVKYELTVGELTNIRQALLPIMAAIGGVLAPIGIYLAFNATNPETVQGWGVPTATDIAFALGILAVLGNRVPSGVRVCWWVPCCGTACSCRAFTPPLRACCWRSLSRRGRALISRASSRGRATRFVRRATRSSPRRPSSRRATTSRP